MLKGCFGLVDAPNLFKSRVDQILRDNGVTPAKADPKIHVRRLSGKHVLMVSAHMDDFKSTGDPEQLRWLHQLLKKHFGDAFKMDLASEFIHTGIRRRINNACDLATLGQDDYAAALKPVSTIHQ